MVISHADALAGGMQKQALCLANELWSRGVSVSIVSKRQRRWISNGKNGRVQPRLELSGGVPCIALPTFALKPSWSFLLSFFVWACINRNQFQIIHAHNAPLGVISALVGWPMHKKVVIKLPGMKYVEYLRGGSFSRQLRRWILTAKANRFISVSSEMAQALRDLGISSDKIAMIPNGIESIKPNDNFNRKALQMKLFGTTAVQVVLFVGRLVKEKGLERLLTVWASMPSREGLYLLIVGDGPLRGELESRAKALRLHESVQFLGNHSNVFQFYAAADLFVLPSRTEGMSNALLEAMAAGLPVVASNIGGNSDVVEDRYSGFLVDWNDTKVCVELLCSLLRDSDLRQRIGSAARKRADAFGIGDIARLYEELYLAVLQE